MAKYETQYSQGNTPAVWANERGESWWIGICNSCTTPCLIRNRGEVVFPTPRPAATDPHVPKELAEDLDEAKLCLGASCYRACAVMARRCLQNACLARGATERDLIKQISELTALGVITKEIEDWATVVRWVGNDAAHPGKDPVTKEDAEDVLRLAEQFLHVVFVTPALAKTRRAARGR